MWAVDKGWECGDEVVRRRCWDRWCHLPFRDLDFNSSNAAILSLHAMLLHLVSLYLQVYLHHLIPCIIFMFMSSLLLVAVSLSRF